MTTILQGVPGSARQLMRVLSDVLQKYEPRINRVGMTMQEQNQPGELHYVIDAELKDVGLVRYGTTFMPEGRVLLRYLKKQQFVDNVMTFRG
ncbi:lysozyme [Escherichia coli]|nr:lysozyme [Escherichia coli]